MTWMRGYWTRLRVPSKRREAVREGTLPPPCPRRRGGVGVLEQGVGGEHGVVRLDDRGGDLRGRVDVVKPSLDLGRSRRLAAIVDGEVPPPTALKTTRKPWSPVQLSASLRMRSPPVS